MPEEKPYQPTPSRLRKARRDGDVAKSSELNGVAAFLCGTLCAFGLAPLAFPLLNDWLRVAASGGFAPGAAFALGGLALAPALAAGLGGALTGIAQTGGLVPKGIKFQPNKLLPHEGFKRMFSRESAIGALRALLAFAICIVMLWPVVPEVLTLGAQLDGPAALAGLARATALRMIVSAIAVGAAFAVVDVLLQRANWMKRLKMSYDELKRDNRESNGDPYLRHRRKQRHQQLARAALNRTREASFVIANPTHIAMALRYAPPEVAVPRVLVRAAEENALRVRAIAEEHGIPVVENVAVARALWAATEPGDAIPAELFVAVAEIVAALMREGVLT